MDTQLVETALLVARLGSFTAAAQARNVDPSSISRQVAALEAALGLRIFERSTRHLRLSEAGEIYLSRMAQALEVMEEAAQSAQDTIATPNGLLRVTTSVAFGERWLVPQLSSFRNLYPQIDLDLILSDAVLDIAEERIDLAIRLGQRPERGAFIASKLFDTHYHVVASPAYLDTSAPLQTPEDLTAHEGLMFRLPAFQADWRFRQRESDRIIRAKPRKSLAISNALALRRAALEGQGVALLADWTIREDLGSGQLRDVFPDWEVSVTETGSAVWLLYPDYAYVPVRLRLFIDHLKSTKVSKIDEIKTGSTV